MNQELSSRILRKQAWPRQQKNRDRPVEETGSEL